MPTSCTHLRPMVSSRSARSESRRASSRTFSSYRTSACGSRVMTESSPTPGTVGRTMPWLGLGARRRHPPGRSDVHRHRSRRRSRPAVERRRRGGTRGERGHLAFDPHPFAAGHRPAAAARVGASRSEADRCRHARTLNRGVDREPRMRLAPGSCAVADSSAGSRCGHTPRLGPRHRRELATGAERGEHGPSGGSICERTPDVPLPLPRQIKLVTSATKRRKEDRDT